MNQNLLSRVTGLLISLNIQPDYAKVSARILIGFAAAILFMLLWIMTKKISSQLLMKVNARIEIAKNDEVLKKGLIKGISITIPSLVLWYMAPVFLTGLDSLLTFVRIVALLAIIASITRSIISILNLVNSLYNRREDSRRRPIKGLIQAVKVLLIIAALIISFSVILKQPVSGLLAGLGALSAVSMFVFKDMIMGLVSGFQISGNDMVRIGDWIEVPSHGADGDVIDISLLNVTVQNWDKTWITFPIQALTTGGFKNWRGMTNAGGRRIKRSVFLDMSSIRFIDEEEIKKLESIDILAGYLDERNNEIHQYNSSRKIDRKTNPVNGRAMTNIGVFRAYAKAYVSSHPNVAPDMTLLVRQLQSGPAGLPLEIYCFSTDTAWAGYENIQSDIFDHLFASLSVFGLKAFQEPAGTDIRQLSERKPESAAEGKS